MTITTMTLTDAEERELDRLYVRAGSNNCPPALLARFETLRNRTMQPILERAYRVQVEAQRDYVMELMEGS